MTGALMLAAMWISRPTAGFVARHNSVGYRYGRSIAGASTSATVWKRRVKETTTSGFRLFSSNDRFSRTARVASLVDQHVSRLSTLQKLLQSCGAPGSIGCSHAGGDLLPIQGLLEAAKQDVDSSTPELVASLCDEQSAALSQEELCGLHPYLYPMARSSSTGNLICAYCAPPLDATVPWPIVETAINAPGVRLLALNSEHMMRRIVAQFDSEVQSSGSTDEQPMANQQQILELYNDGLGKGLLKDAGLDAPYVPGSVAKLGYGLDKYVLLRVGPFPDLYQSVSSQHLSKGDVQAALIAAESSSGKLTGFASTFLSYAKLLQSLPNREEEARDAARNCLRMPLWTVGVSMKDVKDVAVLGQVADEMDTIETVLGKLVIVYEKVMAAESESAKVPGDTSGATQSPDQVAMEECQDVLNRAVLQQKPWNEVRSSVAQIYRAAGLADMAEFIEEVSSSTMASATTTRSVLQ
jgi:hypothetical protein